MERRRWCIRQELRIPIGRPYLEKHCPISDRYPPATKIPATCVRPVPIRFSGRSMRLPSRSLIRRILEEPPSPQAISLRQLPAGSLGWGSFRMAITTLHTRSNTWRASSCRLGLGMSLLSSNPNGGPGPKSFAFPKSCRVGGSREH